MELTVRVLFEMLGFDHPGNDVDESVRWALIELYLRRKETSNGDNNASAS